MKKQFYMEVASSRSELALLRTDAPFKVGWLVALFLITIQSMTMKAQVWYSQSSGPWSTTTLGTCTGTTIGNAGCAMSSVCMMFNGQYDPGTFNTYLKSNGGYSSGCEIVWSAIPSCKNVSYDAAGTTAMNDYSTLYNKIQAGCQAVVKVHYIGHSGTAYDHWVLVTGFTGSSAQYNNGNYYTVYDPGPSAFYSRTLSNYGNTGFVNAKYYKVFKPSSAITGLGGTCGTSPSIENIWWTAKAGATGYEISYKKSVTSVWTIINVTNNSYSLSNLTKSTTYQVRVRAKHCSNFGQYSATFTFSTGIFKTDETDSTEQATTTSIDNPEEKSNKFLLYPNPVAANGVINICCHAEKMTIKVIDISGKEVKQLDFDENNEGLITFTAPEVKGIYFIQIMYSSEKTEIKRLVVQ